MDANAISHGQGTAQAAGNDMTRTQVTEQDTAQAEVTSKRCRKNNKESENSTRKAECKYCKKVYVADSKFHGTSNLLSHAATCAKNPYTAEVNGQKTLGFQPKKDGEEGVELVSMSFSVEAARKALAEMIVTDELSFSASEASNFEVDDDCDDPHALIACQFSSYLEEEYSSLILQKYPALSQLARDVLAMPISTVASESTFSTGGRILDPFRSSLSPMMVEVLICAQNWLRSSLQISLGKAMDSVEDFEKQFEIG
ncbi:hypothetical protein Acr_00g0045900 [Actinidia rufa]|uniref:HAT C-terminal dimerisation domain-containing protein n=1 Tax=Actinidia rufa TaxID=165716 RepID=A0A7J0DJE6_9ERIC|nr:hypothetical protein Acr_00g0045900 [Actinidia rufa]